MERLVSRTEATPSKSCETAKSTTRNCRRNRNDFRPLPSDPGRGINKYCTLLYRREELEEVAVAGSGQVLDGELTMMTMKYGELSSRDTLFSFFFFSLSRTGPSVLLLEICCHRHELVWRMWPTSWPGCSMTTTSGSVPTLEVYTFTFPNCDDYDYWTRGWGGKKSHQKEWEEDKKGHREEE